MSRVEFAEAMMEPFPAESASLADLVQEMVFHAGVPPSCAGVLLATYQHEASDVEDLKRLARPTVVAMHEQHGLGDAVVTKLGMILGTLVKPHIFHDPIAQAPLLDNDVIEGGKANKGGPTTNVGEVLQTRRPPRTEYFPPSIFDDHRIGSAKRNEKTISMLIVQEVSRRVSLSLPSAPATLSNPHPPMSCRFSRMMVTSIPPARSSTSSFPSLSVL